MRGGQLNSIKDFAITLRAANAMRLGSEVAFRQRPLTNNMRLPLVALKVSLQALRAGNWLNSDGLFRARRLG
jgi:hypothetical protein